MNALMLFAQQFGNNPQFQQQMAQMKQTLMIVQGVGLVVGLFFVFVMWKVYTKADKPGWAAIVPIYNLVVLLEIVNRPLWWIVLMFIPLVNIVAIFIIYIDLAKAFGKSTGFGLGLIFLSPIFLPILAFGSAEFVGIERAE